MRRLLVLLVTLGVVAVPSVAHAVTCPSGATGTNPTKAEIAALIADKADDATPVIPVGVLKAIAYRETEWQQYDTGGHVVISSDGNCGVGIMQVTAADDADPDRLASDVAYNVQRGAEILRQKWAASQTSNPPNDTGLHDDPAITENWFYAVCLYNGSCDVSYPTRVAELSADPFRRVPDDFKPYMPIQGFTKPQEAKEDYVFPNAYQVRPGQFVFYDEPTGNVTETVSAITHAYNSPPPTIAYGTGAYGPDGPGVSCVTCGGWRLAEGRGVAGRAHWTLSAATEGTRVTWAPVLPRTGTYRVSAYVPDVSGLQPMGTATYHLAGTTVDVDQAANADEWVPLGDRTLSPGATVFVNDVAATANQRLVADAVRFAAVTRLDATASASTVTYGQSATLTLRLSHLGTTTGLTGKPVALYKRRAGTTPWSYVGTYATGTDGKVAVTVKPSVNAEYQARYAGAGDFTEATSATRRVNVRTLVKATLSRTTVPRNTAVTVSASVSPNHAGQTVYLQRYYSGAWHTSLSKALSSSSTAAFTFAKSAGTYTYRVYKPADADHVASYGPTLTLKVT